MLARCSGWRLIASRLRDSAGLSPASPRHRACVDFQLCEYETTVGGASQHIVALWRVNVP